MGNGDDCAIFEYASSQSCLKHCICFNVDSSLVIVRRYSNAYQGCSCENILLLRPEEECLLASRAHEPGSPTAFDLDLDWLLSSRHDLSKSDIVVHGSKVFNGLLPAF